MAEIKEIQNEILKYLYKGYLDYGGTSSFTIDDITNKYGVSSHEFGKHLLDRGYIKDQQYLPQEFAASITMHGINEIDPDYLENHTSTMLSTLGLNGGEWQGVSELLNLERKDHQIARDLANEWKSMGFVEVQFDHNDAYIKLTLHGRSVYEENKAFFAK